MLRRDEVLVPKIFRLELDVADEADERVGGGVCKVWVCQTTVHPLIAEHRSDVCHGCGYIGVPFDLLIV